MDSVPVISEFGRSVARRGRVQVRGGAFGRTRSIGLVARASVGFGYAIGRALAVRPVVDGRELNTFALRPPVRFRRRDTWRADAGLETVTSPDNVGDLGTDGRPADEPAATKVRAQQLVAKAPRTIGTDAPRDRVESRRPTWTDRLIDSGRTDAIARSSAAPTGSSTAAATATATATGRRVPRRPGRRDKLAELRDALADGSLGGPPSVQTTSAEPSSSVDGAPMPERVLRQRSTRQPAEPEDTPTRGDEVRSVLGQTHAGPGTAPGRLGRSISPERDERVPRRPAARTRDASDEPSTVHRGESSPSPVARRPSWRSDSGPTTRRFESRDDRRMRLLHEHLDSLDAGSDSLDAGTATSSDAAASGAGPGAPRQGDRGGRHDGRVDTGTPRPRDRRSDSSPTHETPRPTDGGVVESSGLAVAPPWSADAPAQREPGQREPRQFDAHRAPPDSHVVRAQSTLEAIRVSRQPVLPGNPRSLRAAGLDAGGSPTAAGQVIRRVTLPRAFSNSHRPPTAAAIRRTDVVTSSEHVLAVGSRVGELPEDETSTATDGQRHRGEAAERSESQILSTDRAVDTVAAPARPRAASHPAGSPAASRSTTSGRTEPHDLGGVELVSTQRASERDPNTGRRDELGTTGRSSAEPVRRREGRHGVPPSAHRSIVRPGSGALLRAAHSTIGAPTRSTVDAPRAPFGDGLSNAVRASDEPVHDRPAVRSADAARRRIKSDPGVVRNVTPDDVPHDDELRSVAQLPSEADDGIVVRRQTTAERSSTRRPPTRQSTSPQPTSPRSAIDGPPGAPSTVHRATVHLPTARLPTERRAIDDGPTAGDPVSDRPTIARSEGDTRAPERPPVDGRQTVWRRSAKTTPQTTHETIPQTVTQAPEAPAAPGRGITELADRFMSELASQTRERPAPLPTAFQPMADVIVGRRRVMLSTDRASRRALRSVGKVAATTGDVIHLDRDAQPDRRTTEVVAHELTHVAHPSPIPRFFDDPDDSPEERRAEQVASLMARAPVVSTRRSSPASHRSIQRATVETRRDHAGSTVSAAALAERLTGGGSARTRSSGGDSVMRLVDTSGGRHDAMSDSFASGGAVARAGVSQDVSGWADSSMGREWFREQLRRNFDDLVHQIEDRMIIEFERRGGRNWGAL